MTEIPTANLLAQEPERDDPRPPVVEPKRPGKIACLDGLRGIAALVVIFAHFRELVWPGSLFAQHVPFGFVIERSPLMLGDGSTDFRSTSARRRSIDIFIVPEAPSRRGIAICVDLEAEARRSGFQTGDVRFAQRL